MCEYNERGPARTSMDDQRSANKTNDEQETNDSKKRN